MSSPSFDLSVVREAKENPEKTGRVKSLVFHAAFFFSWCSFASHTTDKSQEGLSEV